MNEDGSAQVECTEEPGMEPGAFRCFVPVESNFVIIILTVHVLYDLVKRLPREHILLTVLYTRCKLVILPCGLLTDRIV